MSNKNEQNPLTLHEYQSKMLYLNRAIRLAKDAHDYLSLEVFVTERNNLTERFQKERHEEREKKRYLKVADSLAFAPIVQERANELHYDREPLPHQMNGAIQLASAGSGLLADEPRLGKTFTSHIWADLVKVQRTLIIAPREVQTTFMGQLAANGINKPVAKLGQMTSQQRITTLKFVRENFAKSGFMVVINYEGLRRDRLLIAELQRTYFDSLIIDESHNINKTNTTTFRSIKAIRYAENWCPRHHDLFTSSYRDKPTDPPRCGDCKQFLTSSISNVLCMTGSPILNRPQELFSQLHMINRVEWPTERGFLYDFCINVGGKWTWRYKGEERLAEQLGPKLVQRKAKEAGITIPPQDITIHEIEFNAEKYPNQARVIEEIEKYAAIAFEGLVADGASDIIMVPSQLAEITRMRQVMVWPAGIGIPCGHCDQCMQVPSKACPNKRKLDVRESHKFDAALAFVKETAESDTRIIVFSQFVDVLYEFTDKLKEAGIKAVTYTGKTPTWEREEIKEDFKYVPGRPWRWQVACVNSKTGGVGLDLAGADVVVALDDEWNPGKGDQRDHRVINMLKQTTTAVHIFRVMESIDDWMAEILEQKGSMISSWEATRKIIDKLAAKFLGFKELKESKK